MKTPMNKEFNTRQGKHTDQTRQGKHTETLANVVRFPIVLHRPAQNVNNSHKNIQTRYQFILSASQQLLSLNTESLEKVLANVKKLSAHVKTFWGKIPLAVFTRDALRADRV